MESNWDQVDQKINNKYSQKIFLKEKYEHHRLCELLNVRNQKYALTNNQSNAEQECFRWRTLHHQRNHVMIVFINLLMHYRNILKLCLFDEGLSFFTIEDIHKQNVYVYDIAHKQLKARERKHDLYYIFFNI